MNRRLKVKPRRVTRRRRAARAGRVYLRVINGVPQVRVRRPVLPQRKLYRRLLGVQPQLQVKPLLKRKRHKRRPRQLQLLRQIVVVQPVAVNAQRARLFKRRGRPILKKKPHRQNDLLTPPVPTGNFLGLY